MTKKKKKNSIVTQYRKFGQCMSESHLFVIEMVRFSCFSTNNLHHRSKKEISESSEPMSKTSEDCSKDQELKVPGVSNGLAPLMEESYVNPSNTNLEEDTSFSVDNYVRPGETHNSDSSPEANLVVHQKMGLQRSQSFESVLDREGRVSSGDSEEYDQEISYDRHEGNNNVKFFEDPKLHEDGSGHLANPEHIAPGTQSIKEESRSLTNTGHFSPTSEDGSPPHAYAVHCYRSYGDLNALDDEFQNRVIKFDTVDDEERDDDMLKNANSRGDDPSVERYQGKSYDYPFGKDWSMNEDDTVCKHEGEQSLQDLNALPIEDFKIKRIEEWVSMIDLEGSKSLEETNESPTSVNQVNKASYMLGSPSPAKLDPKSIHGMEAAKNYVSSLPATSTSVLLANHGLVVVPFLSALVNLKTLNLSGNAIVRITSGSLPRGLHVLNLAKNSISTIEGLRELTRLRVLDLSYNRILRIGHGLASCSSLKELYLAGNKISEVEGLHRLLKLNVLDLRFNKISTTKCLGQLAANYSSLQAINLEGNPAQRNVGDEQLKKFLQNSLPHLVNYNKQTLKASTSKEVVDRSSRPAVASRQLERGVRSDHKPVRKGNHIISSGRTSSSSGHGYRSQAVRSPKHSRDRVGHLPPTGIKGSTRHHHPEFVSKLLSFQSDLAMRRSRSEGNLGGN